MIRFEKVTLRNYKSFGNSPTTFTFHGGELGRIRGSNGMGKSTIMEALFFCLYNKSMTGVTKDDLINSINRKQLEVAVEFHKGEKHYLIERGVKPNYLRLFIDGEEQDKSANVRDDQRIVEEILEMNANTFRNTVVMSEDSSKFFMEMTPAERREIVEELLNIRQFSVMADVLKVYTSTITTDLKEAEIKVTAQEQVVAAAVENFETMKRLAAVEKERKEIRLRELTEELDFAKAKKIDCEKTISDIRDSVKDLPSEAALKEAEEDTVTFLAGHTEDLKNADTELLAKQVRLAEVRNDELHVKEKEDSLKAIMSTTESEFEGYVVKVAGLEGELKGKPDPEKLSQRIEEITDEMNAIQRENILYWNTKWAEADRFSELIAEGKCPTCQRDATAADFEFPSKDDCQNNIDEFEAKVRTLQDEQRNIREEKTTIVNMAQEFLRATEMMKEKEFAFAAAKEAYTSFMDMVAVAVIPEEIERDIKRLNDVIEDLREKSEKMSTRLDKVLAMLTQSKEATKTLEMADINMRQIGNLIESTTVKLETVDDESAIDLDGEQDRLADVSRDLEDLKSGVEGYNKTLEYYALIKKILSDSGIKAHIVDIYIPFLNERINHYLVELDAYYDFHFTSTFDVQIKSRFRDKFRYESFSSGQKSRINIAIMLAFVDLAGAKSTIITNLMFLDELLDSHLDDQGCDDILRVLRRKASDEQKAINIISHKSGLVEGFDREYLAQLEDNFTTITEVY